MSVNMEAFQQFYGAVQRLGETAPQDELSDEERVRRAKAKMIEKIDARMATDLESCVHCGMCAEACPFYITTHDGKYTPVHKLFLLRRVFRRELSPNRWLHRLFRRDITVKDLEAWQELVYDSCTECGRCSLICPMGIHISDMVAVMRQALSSAGLTVAEQRAMSREQGEKGTVFGIGQEQLLQAVEKLTEQGYEAYVDKPGSEIMVLTTVVDIMLFTDALVSTTRILNQIGRPWSFCSHGFEAANFGYMSGNEKWQKATSMRLIEAAVACGAKTVLVPECGHAYPALRWEGANVYGKPLPFEVVAISEFIGREIKAGTLKVKPIGKHKKVTFHDPCKIGRLGGVFEEPREALKALQVDFRELDPGKVQNWCCGGGAGVFLINRAAPLRQKVFDLKRRQVEHTGADSVVTACGSCRINLMAGAVQSHWPKGIESLVELVGANLAE